MRTKRWSKRLALGIDEIDWEHEEIHRLIGLLQDALRTGNRDIVQREIVQAVLSQVLTFAQHHFESEEKLMKRVHFPEYCEHKEEHELFLQRVRDLMERLHASEVPPTSETMNTLNNWLHHHVLGTDTKYVPYLFSSPAAGVNVQRDAGTTFCATMGDGRTIPAVDQGKVARRK